VLPRVGEVSVDAWTQVGGGGDRGVLPLESREGHDGVAVHRDDGNRGTPGQRLRLVGNHEAGEVVGDDESGPLGEPGHETSARSPLRLHEGPVGETEPGRRLAIGLHALEDEAVVPDAGPRVVKPEPFVDDEWLAPFVGAPERLVERVVAFEAAIGLHPVEDVVAARAVGAAADVVHTDVRVGHHLMVPRRVRQC